MPSVTASLLTAPPWIEDARDPVVSDAGELPLNRSISVKNWFVPPIVVPLFLLLIAAIYALAR